MPTYSRGVSHGASWRRASVAAIVLLLALFGASALTASAAPAITTINPTQGPVAGGTTITITGTGFTGATGVIIDGTNVPVTVVDDTEATAVTPAHAAGAVNVFVVTAGGNGTSATFNYVGAVPTVTGLSPATGSTAGGTPVTITGTDFTGTTGVTFGGNAAAFTLNSATSITATSPVHAIGSVDVVVTTLAGPSPNTAADDFTYQTPAPVITTLTPAGGPVEGGTAVTITGTGLTGATIVNFGGIPLTPVVVNDTTITVTSPVHAAGSAAVIVTTPGGTSAAVNFTYGAGPVVTSVSPNIGGIAGGALVTITGTGLTGATAVTFGGTAGTGITVVSDTSLTVTAPAHVAGVVDVIVTTPVGTSTNTTNDNFAYTAAPFITAISPAGGPLAGGTTVTLTGSGFTGATSVTFGGVSGTSITVLNDTSLTVVSPLHAAGVVDIAVTTPQGTSTNTTADNFTYGAGPVITSISPTSGPIAGGTTITITGTGLAGATSVTIGGTDVTPTAVTETSITVVSPAHVAGKVDIAVTTPIGTSTNTSADDFTYGAGSTTSYTLYFRWTLLVWTGQENVDIDTTLAGEETPDITATNDISSQVTAIFRYNNQLQKFEAWFPNSSSIPGAVDFTTFNSGRAYWIAIAGPGSVTWTVVAG